MAYERAAHEAEEEIKRHLDYIYKFETEDL
jgi:hypothetical protein